MLSEEQKRKIHAEFEFYAQRRAVLPEALRIVQYDTRWISDENVKDIAAFMGMTEAEVDSVATFYPMIFREPVGRHVILLCDSVSCWIMGFTTVKEHLAARLGIGFGETTEDGRFTLLPAPCLGACDNAPAMMIDDDLHVDLTPETIDEILETYE